MPKNENGEDSGALTLFAKPGGTVVKTNTQRFLQNAAVVASSSRSELPFVNFGHKDGVWAFGKDGEEMDMDGNYAVDPNSIEQGFIAWKDQKPYVKMVPFGEPLPDLATLPDIGKPYEAAYSLHLKALTGRQKGQMFLYRNNTYGFRDFAEKLIAAIGATTVQAGLEDGDLAVPVIQLADSFWTHREHGRIYKPEYELVKWLRYSDGSPIDADDDRVEIIPPTPPKPKDDNVAGRRRRPTS